MTCYKHFIIKILFSFFVLISIARAVYPQPLQKIQLAKNNKAQVSVILPDQPTETIQFAASELSKYLHQISNATFVVFSDQHLQSPAIIIEQDKTKQQEEYAIEIAKQNIILSGGSGRAVLYAVYDFLERLGCRWLAPGFSLYNGSAEYIPRNMNLVYETNGKVYSHPQFTYRNLDVEEGRSHNIENLKQLVDWMPKLRFNILMVPLDYGGNGRVQWDKWREALTPELKKRDLLIEVGGHGYQNFLNAGMNDSLFKQHPDWFGKDKNCNPNSSEYLVFNTSNHDAAQYLIHNILKYIRQHPEIDIFDFWPPDGARWAECPEFAALGSPLDRQAFLVNQVDSALKKVRPGLQLEMIAYQPVLLPPPTQHLNKDILVDFCPINQSFEKQIYDSSSRNNSEYADALLQWRKSFNGDIGLYSYYRKYAWRSLPNLIPHYMQYEMQWYAKIPLQGIGSYAEPGDWFTYELNYYVLGHLAWNTNTRVDSLIDQFCHARYGAAWKIAKSVFNTLENTVRIYGNIPYTTVKPVRKIMDAEKELAKRMKEVRASIKNSGDVALSANLSRLLLVLQYADYDLQIQQARASDMQNVGKKIEEMVSFLETNETRGVFILPRTNILDTFKKRYGIK